MSGKQSQPVIVMLAASGLLSSATVCAGMPLYTVAVDENLANLDVKACFEESAPRRLKAHHEDAPHLAGNVRLYVRDNVIKLEPRGTSLTLPRYEAPACVSYRVDLSAIDTRHWRSENWRTRDTIILDPRLWLWLPDSMQARWRIDFDLPSGYDVSAPWKRLNQTGQLVSYQARDRMLEREARVAIGRFDVEVLELDGGRIRYALLQGEPEADADFLRHWISSGARALESAYGRLPVADLQLLVVPIGQGDEPVPWGEVQRGGGDAVHLFIDQRVAEEAFRDDWVMVHELSHLLHPVIVSDDRWLSEGIASYYQNVLRARAGLKSAADAWNKLHAGFERGVRGARPGRNLAEISETMMRDRSFMRVYWSGAAIALLADVELRRRSDDTQSLDTALSAFRDCCLHADRVWTARAFMGKLDQLTATTVFMDLYREHVDSDEFPDLSEVYAELGLQRMSTTRLRLDPDASGAAICESIMAAPGS